jgi:hypothetical protein
MPPRKPRKTEKSKPDRRRPQTARIRQRLWLMYPPQLIEEPLVWQLGRKFKIVTNIRQAGVTEEIGVVCLEVDGREKDIKASIQWLEKFGVKVEPVEVSLIES